MFLMRSIFALSIPLSSDTRMHGERERERERERALLGLRGVSDYQAYHLFDCQ